MLSAYIIARHHTLLYSLPPSPTFADIPVTDADCPFIDDTLLRDIDLRCPPPDEDNATNMARYYMLDVDAA